MPQAIALSDIQTLQASAAQGNLGGVCNTLRDLGYQYPTLVLGIFDNDSLAGAAALAFMHASAAQQGKPLTESRLAKLKIDMAKEYLRTLESLIKNDIDVVTRDVSGNEVWNIHNKVFVENHLDPDTWTLNTPFKILKRSGGDEAVEAYWKDLLQNSSDPFTDKISLAPTSMLMGMIAEYANDPLSRAEAKAWLDRTPGYSSIQKGVNTYEFARTLVIGGFLNPAFINAARLFNDFLAHPVPISNHDQLGNFIGDLQSRFQQAETPVGPLALDLDGDGVETLGKSEGIHFDHDGNGFAETLSDDSGDHKSGGVNADRLAFAEVVCSELATVRCGGKHLKTGYGGSDCLPIRNHFYGTEYRIEQFEFCDGMTSTIVEIVVRVAGTAANDSVAGLTGVTSTLRGQAGDDWLGGEECVDTMRSGDGNDPLKSSGGWTQLEHQLDQLIEAMTAFAPSALRLAPDPPA